MYDIELTDKEPHGKASYDTERFKLKTGDVVRFVKSNVKYENGVYNDGSVCDVALIDSVVSLYTTEDTELKLTSNHKLSTDFDVTYTVKNDVSIANVQFWKTNSGSFKVEYDIELYVNDVRYI